MKFWLLLAIVSSLARVSAQERCGTAQDLVVSARERLAQSTDAGDLQDSLQLLKRATELCVSLGDAWYLRALLERKLGRNQLADFAASKAKLFGSELSSQGVNPLSVPAAAPQPAALGEVQQKWALVVGVSEFKDPRAPALRYTAKDARDISSLLLDARYGRFAPANVHVLIDKQATTVNIKRELNWLARSAGKDDLVVVYLASHGSPRDMDTAGVSYVVTHDTDLQSQDSLYATSLPMVDLADAIRSRIQAQRAVVFLDTCYSGAAAAGPSASRDLRYEAAGVSPRTFEHVKQGAGRVIITSSSVSEKSWESEELGNGIFTYYLLEALRLQQGLLPIDRVYQHLRGKVIERVAADKKAIQTPMLTKSQQSGDLIVGVKPLGP